ncbi:unnamed protein product [Staurois parvus]|uniref:Uncharacterized protein n=1 Tax=Staurois parvus TaxID=386267 RepID=A0ABN9DBQ4_9NEOB|nr:unnamed protein product [Staurois parvus]
MHLGAYLAQGTCLGWHFFRGAAPPPRRRDERKDMCTMGTRWDPRKTAGCLMVYVEPDSHSWGCPKL